MLPIRYFVRREPATRSRVIPKTPGWRSLAYGSSYNIYIALFGDADDTLEVSARFQNTEADAATPGLTTGVALKEKRSRDLPGTGEVMEAAPATGSCVRPRTAQVMQCHSLMPMMEYHLVRCMEFQGRGLRTDASCQPSTGALRGPTTLESVMSIT